MRRRFINNRHVAYNQTEYLSFEALEDGFVLTFPQNLKYSINGGVWENLPSYTRTKPINSGDIISLQGDCEIFTYEGVGTFNFNKKCNVFGNILSIIGYKNLQAHAFVNLFANGTIVDSSNLILPIDLTVLCYSDMFYNCKSLVKAPELPATTLAAFCYSNMFYNCTSLVNAPELPATTLAHGCYSGMFFGCTNLSYIKALCIIEGVSIDYTTSWVSGVSPTGTFVSNKNAVWYVKGAAGTPEG